MVQFCQHIKKDSKDKNAFEHTINSKPCGEEVTLESGQFHNVKPLFFSKWGKHSLPGWRDTQAPYCTNKRMYMCVFMWLLAILRNISEKQEGKE